MLITGGSSFKPSFMPILSFLLSFESENGLSSVGGGLAMNFLKGSNCSSYFFLTGSLIRNLFY